MPFLVAAVLALPATAHAETWHWPVRGEVVNHFRLGPNPYAPGQHRGIDIAAAPGAAVRAACAGRVRSAGRVPKAGRTISVRCGPLVATYLHLRSIAVRRGQRIVARERIGTAGRTFQLGARRAGERHGYVDPLALLEADPLGPAPPALPLARPRRPEAPPPAIAFPGPPLAAWAGVGLLGAAVPGLALVTARRRRRARRAPAARLAPRRVGR